MRSWGLPLDTTELTETASAWIQADVSGTLLSALLDLGLNIGTYPIEKNDGFYPDREPNQTSLLADAILGAGRDQRGSEGFYMQQAPRAYAYGAKRDFGAFKSCFIGRIKTLLEIWSQSHRSGLELRFVSMDAYSWWAHESLGQELFDVLDKAGAVAQLTSSG